MNECARVLARFIFLFFFRRSMAANSEVSGGILPKFELKNKFKTFMVFFTWKNEENPIKMKALEC